MTIHTFGDSHAHFGFHMIPGVTVHHLGAILCYSVGRDGISIENQGVQNGDTVIFCFGEIDARCHIHKHISESQTYQIIIDTLVEKYFARIATAVSVFENLNVAVYNVVPPIRKTAANENENFPFVGTDEERKSYVQYFNAALRKKCVEYNYVFFDVYEKYADDQGFLNIDLSDGSVHINVPVHICEFIQQKLNR